MSICWSLPSAHGVVVYFDALNFWFFSCVSIPHTRPTWSYAFCVCVCVCVPFFCFRLKYAHAIRTCISFIFISVFKDILTILIFGFNGHFKWIHTVCKLLWDYYENTVHCLFHRWAKNYALHFERIGFYGIHYLRMFV